MRRSRQGPLGPAGTGSNTAARDSDLDSGKASGQGLTEDEIKTNTNAWLDEQVRVNGMAAYIAGHHAHGNGMHATSTSNASNAKASNASASNANQQRQRRECRRQ
ncbi:hypothetical protein GE09DRAFT_1225614 [Coniochaeta sp. 2T2.1]|nr:hypothetical protein GE09DRAFT_1225614 [Coniochaeta sp. 2T2.1]